MVISFGVDRLSPWWTGSFVEDAPPPLIGVSLSNVRVIMAFMCVLVVESLCQAMMGWIPALDWLLLGASGSQWLRLVLFGIKCPHHPRAPRLLESLDRYRDPHAWLPGSQVHAEPGHKGELDRAHKWQNPTRSRSLRWDKRTGVYRAQV
jgi:hypothetical protein